MTGRHLLIVLVYRRASLSPGRASGSGVGGGEIGAGGQRRSASEELGGFGGRHHSGRDEDLQPVRQVRDQGAVLGGPRISSALIRRTGGSQLPAPARPGSSTP